MRPAILGAIAAGVVAAIARSLDFSDADNSMYVSLISVGGL